MTAPVKLDPWENIIINEGKIKNQADGNNIEIFNSIEFQNEYGDLLIIPNLYNNKIFHQLSEKIQKDTFNNQDFHRLILAFEQFINNLIYLFRKIGPKLNKTRDDKFNRILNTIDLVFSSFGLQFSHGGGNYYSYAEVLYNNFLICLREIEKFTEIRVHKGVPHQMLSLIYYNTDRVMRMFGQIGSTLREDRLTGIFSTPADSFLNLIEEENFSFFEEQYNEIISSPVKTLLRMTKSIPTFRDLITHLKKNMTDFPVYALTYLTIKYKFMRKYLYEELDYVDVFSSILRLELLNFFTAFIETLLRKVLSQPPSQLLYNLMNLFTSKALTFPLKLSSYKQKITSYNVFEVAHKKDDPDFYQEFCNYILNMTITEPTDITNIDITTDDKLKIFQSIMVIYQTRNSLHHELNIILAQRSVRTGIPLTIPYLSDIAKYKSIFELHRYLTCLIFLYAYEIK